QNLQPLISVCAAVTQDVLFRREVFDFPANQYGEFVAQRDKAAIEMQNRLWILLERCGVDMNVIAEGEPWAATGETGIGRSVPGHGRSLRVASLADSRLILLGGILYFFRRDRHVTHTEFFTVVEGQRAGEGHEQHGSDRRKAGPNAARDAGLIMVAEYPVGPRAGGKRGVIFRNDLGESLRAPGTLQQLEVEGQVGAT